MGISQTPWRFSAKKTMGIFMDFLWFIAYNLKLLDGEINCNIWSMVNFHVFGQKPIWLCLSLSEIRVAPSIWWFCHHLPHWILERMQVPVTLKMKLTYQ
jgi:hypothetical protein